MNELEVAARVAGNIPREEPPQVAPVAPITAPEPTDEQYVWNNPLDELSMYKLYDYFNIDMLQRGDHETTKIMDKLVEWAVSNGAIEYHDVIGKVREIQRMLGKNDLNDLYRFAKLDMQRVKLDAEMRAIYG